MVNNRYCAKFTNPLMERVRPEMVRMEKGTD